MEKALKEQIVDYISQKCKEEGLETKPRIGRMAQELNADKDEVIEAVKELEASGIVEYVTESTGGGESHICPVKEKFLEQV